MSRTHRDVREIDGGVVGITVILAGNFRQKLRES